MDPRARIFERSRPLTAVCLRMILRVFLLSPRLCA
jgi:hypothetical protein